MSLGMSFARRRMTAAARKEPKYVWAVYDYAWVRDDDNAITGSFSATRTRTKMAASSYTVNEGGFALKQAWSTSLSGLAVGDYIVSVSTSSSTATTGQYLYEVTAKSGSYTTTITYKRYSVVAARGETELYRIESDTPDYPTDGAQDGLWYVMVKGERITYVWDVYGVKEITEYVIVTDTENRKLSPSKGTQYAVGTFNSKTGQFELTSVISLSDPSSQFSDKYYYPNSSATNKSIAYYGVSGLSTTEIGFSWTSTLYSSAQKTTITKGNATGTIVESTNPNEYPEDSYIDSVWYTYSHSYTEEFDDR